MSLRGPLDSSIGLLGGWARLLASCVCDLLIYDVFSVRFMALDVIGNRGMKIW